MTRRPLAVFVALLIALSQGSFQALVWAQDARHHIDTGAPSGQTQGGQSQGGSQQPIGLWARENQINNRNLATNNGIRVEQPKVYDDALLQQMLQAAQARLMALQVLDQASIIQRLGAVSGATQQISSFGLNVQGP